MNCKVELIEQSKCVVRNVKVESEDPEEAKELAKRIFNDLEGFCVSETLKKAR